MSARTRRGITLLWTALFVFSLLLQYASFAAPAKSLAAVPSAATTPFELDGNAVHATLHDWDQVYADRNDPGAPYPHSGADNQVFVADKTGQGDDILTGGNTKDVDNLSSWLWKQSSTTSVQDKDDIENAFAAAYTASNGHTVGYFGLDRFSIDGDATAGFWFFKNGVAKSGSGGGNGTGFTGVHANGDVLVVIDFSNGGANGTAQVYKWQNGALVDTGTTGGDCDGTAQPVCAISNIADATSPWPYTPKSGTDGVFPAAPVKNSSQGAGALYEGGIDMTELGLDTGCFASFMAETRSSNSETSTLSDFVLGNFSFCVQPDIETQVSDSSVSVGDSVTDLATLTGTKGTVEGSVDFFVCGPTNSAQNCTTGGDKVGGTMTLSGGSATSAAFTPDAPGFYCFRAEYTPAAGSKYLAASHTNHTTECFEAKPAEIHVAKTADAASVSAGDQIGFTVTLSNSGTGQAKGVAFSDDLPAGTGVSWSIDAANSDSGWSVTGTAPNQHLAFSGTTLAAGASTSAHVVSGTTKDSCKTYDNTASVTTTNDGKDDASASTTVNCPDVSITKTADAASVSAGSQIGFVVTITNSGDGTASGLSFSDPLPAGAGVSWSVDAAHSSSGWSVSGSAPNQTLVYAPTTLAANSSTHVHVVSATTKDSCASYENTATVSTTNDGGGSASASVTVKCPVIEVTKTADAATVNAGGQIGFTVTLANTGDGDAAGLSFSDDLPAGAGVDWSISPASAGWSITGTAPNQHLVYSPTTLAAKSSTSVHVVSATTGESCKTYDNTAQASATNDGSDSASASVTVTCPDITVVKSADNGTISAGETAAFTITVSNHGAGTAKAVVLDDTLPPGNWTTTDNRCQIASGHLTCDLGDLAHNASTDVHVSRETVAADCGTLHNEVDVSASNEAQADTDDNHAEADITVNCPALVITKTADDPVVDAGDQIGFVIEVTNTGAGTAADVTVDDTLPTTAGLVWTIDAAHSDSGCSISSGALSCDFGDLASQASRHVHITSPTTAESCTTIPNTASVSSSNSDGSDDDASVTVDCPNVTVLKTADTGSISAGDTAAFTIVVSNAGPGAAKDVTLHDPLPAGVAWAISPAVTGCAIANNVLDCSWASLASGGSVTIHISGPTDAADCGTLPNTATVDASNEADADSNDNSSTAVITVGCAAIDIEKVADAPVAEAGTGIGFTITVTNNGEGTAAGVHVSDPLPTDAGTSWSIDGSPTGDTAGLTCGIAAGELTCDKASLAPGASFSLHIVSPTTDATVADSPVDNTAFVTTTNDGSDQDSDSVRIPDLTIEKSFTGNSAGTDPVLDVPAAKEGDTLTYTLTYTLTNGPVTGAFITDTLPLGLAYIDGTATGNAELRFTGFDTATRTLRWDAATLTASGSVTYQARVLDGAADQPQPLVNTAAIDSNETDRDSDQASVAVAPPPLPATGTPKPTLPPTDTIAPTTPTQSSTGFSLMVVLLGLAGLALGIGLLTPVPEAARRRERR